MARSMILKSMARQNKSFEALYDYFTKEHDAELFAFNLYSRANDRQSVIDEFLKNAEYIKKARGKNFLYHEILSLKASSLERARLKEILLELAREYIGKRAKDHLVLSALHKEKEHLHLHLMISANALGENYRSRLSKKAFASIQESLENYQNTHFPELYSRHYEKPVQKDKSRDSLKEQEMKTRGSKTKKERLRGIFEEVLSKAANEVELENYLANLGVKIYKRGSTEGLIFEDKKYRLNTLGLLSSYHDKLQEYREREATKNTHFNLKQYFTFVLENSESKKDFYRSLYDKQIEFYDRAGFSELFYAGEWYRLNSLNLARDYEKASRKWQSNTSSRASRDKQNKAFDDFENEK